MMMMLIQSRMIDILLLMIDDASIDTKFDDFAKRDGPTDGPTDTPAHWDAMDAFKKNVKES